MSEKELPHYAKGIMEKYNISMEEMEPVWEQINKINMRTVNQLLLRYGSNSDTFENQLIRFYPVLEKDWVNELFYRKRMFHYSNDFSGSWLLKSLEGDYLDDWKVWDE